MLFVGLCFGKSIEKIIYYTWPHPVINGRKRQMLHIAVAEHNTIYVSQFTSVADSSKCTKVLSLIKMTACVRLRQFTQYKSEQ